MEEFDKIKNFEIILFFHAILINIFLKREIFVDVYGKFLISTKNTERISFSYHIILFYFFNNAFS